MSAAYAVNSVLGSILIVILVFADYIRKYNTDFFQRTIFLTVLGFTFAAITADFLYALLEGSGGRMTGILLYADLTLYYFFQVVSYYLICVFIDYITFKSSARTKKLLGIAIGIQFIHGGILLANLPLGFYFFISPDHVFSYGSLYILRIVISYLPAIFTVIDIILAIRNFKKSQAYLILFFFLLTGAGSVMDIVLKTGSLVWPCYCAALLYIYFFIIKTDSKIDSLTGIGNRYSFNEFIDKLSRSNTRQSYSIVMIDVDRFKEINDTLGHQEGDNALRDLAAIIKGSVRSSDFAARYGGDEFVLATRLENDIEKLMERIQKAIDSQNEKNIRPYKIRISYGHDTFTTKSGQSIEVFLSHIDSLMYKHKAERRRCTDIIPPPEQETPEDRRSG
ncbi:MAG: GGDEF domain-containing protein [Spirochaetaceae bacterium]|jgi:diguanylate cyclase (GGDEF)-like protein|nr:GGDEF domain-containing protein [Spirochaetaceae bacterium]